MKRALTQKVNPIPACAVDDCSIEGSLKPIPPEVNRRARTSAAMIGLAISMGASSVLLARQGNSAMAAEPVANSHLPTVTSAAGDQTNQEVKSVAAAEVLTPKTLEHQVQESQVTRVSTNLTGESFGKAETSLKLHQQTDKVESANGTTFDRSASGSTVAPSWTGKISSQNHQIGDNVNSRETAATTHQTNGAIADRRLQSAEEETSTVVSSSETATATSNVNELLKTKQAVALNRLKESSNRLRNSLAEWKSEESVNTSARRVNEHKAPTVVSEKLKPVIEQSSAAVGDSHWQPKVAAVEPAVNIKPKAKQSTVPSVVLQPVVEQPTVEEATVSVVYQVNPGDTIHAIARNYGVSVATLAKANDLNNPNRIQIAQQLRIPQTANSGFTSTEVAGRNQESGRSIEFTSSKAVPDSSESEPNSPNFAAWKQPNASSKPTVPVVSAFVPTRVADNTSLPIITPGDATAAAFPLPYTGTDDIPDWVDVPNNEPVEEESADVVRTKFLSSTKQTGAYGKAEDSLSAESESEEILVADNITAQQPPDRTKQYTNPYVERLRAEILQLREQYRQNQGSNPSQRNPLLGSQPTPRYPTPSNQEFKPSQYNQALQAEIQRRAEEVPDKLPRTSVPAVPSPAATPSPRRQIIATAPVNPDSYQPYNQPSQERTVSPESPAIPNQYYYPEGLNQQFNGYNWPTTGVLTSGYGRRWGRMHRGIDIAGPTGTPILAAAPGIIVYARWNSGGYGRLVQVMHPDGSITRYAHNSRIYVQEGQVVEQGQHIAAMGSTGRSTGPHCHFEIHPPGRGAANPMAYLPSK